jgi:hypothetical protein
VLNGRLQCIYLVKKASLITLRINNARAVKSMTGTTRKERIWNGVRGEANKGLWRKCRKNLD